MPLTSMPPHFGFQWWPFRWHDGKDISIMYDWLKYLSKLLEPKTRSGLNLLFLSLPPASHCPWRCYHPLLLMFSLSPSRTLWSRWHSVRQVVQAARGRSDGIRHLKANKLQLIWRLFTSKCHMKCECVCLWVRVIAMERTPPPSLPVVPLIWLILKWIASHQELLMTWSNNWRGDWSGDSFIAAALTPPLRPIWELLPGICKWQLIGETHCWIFLLFCVKTQA